VSGAGVVDASRMSWSLWDIASEPSRDLDMTLAMPAPRLEEVAYAQPAAAPAPAVPEPAIQVVADNETITGDMSEELIPVPHPRPLRVKAPVVTTPRLTAAVVKEPAPAVRKFRLDGLWIIGAYRWTRAE
jgi:hypothetical protein